MPGKPVMTAKALEDYLYEVFPELYDGDARPFIVEAVEPGQASVRFKATAADLRPGGTISGPAIMTLADLALYAVILAHIGPEPLAVTTSLSFNFLRKAESGDLIGTARLLKLGKRLAVGEIAIVCENGGPIVAHATGTYSLPAKGRA